jgi:hypothetical protein
VNSDSEYDDESDEHDEHDEFNGIERVGEVGIAEGNQLARCDAKWIVKGEVARDFYDNLRDTSQTCQRRYPTSVAVSDANVTDIQQNGLAFDRTNLTIANCSY